MQHGGCVIDVDQSGHSSSEDGPLTAVDGALYNLVDWARMLAIHRGHPFVLLPVCLEVLDTVERAGLPVFVTKPLDYARKLPPEVVAAGLAELREAYANAVTLEDLYLRGRNQRGQLAILQRDACQAFGFEVSDENETKEQRQDRRLARFYELGGLLREAGSGVHTAGRRGALSDLVKEEKAAGQPWRERADVKRDIEAAFKRRETRPAPLRIVAA